MDDLETPVTIEKAIESVANFGRAYALEYSPKCDGINDTWLFQNGEIKGPQSSTPDHLSNEQWVNCCMSELYADLCITPLERNAYYRFTAKIKEYEDAECGIFQRSQNHRDSGFYERDNSIDEMGKSVAIGPLFIYFVDRPISFLLKGDLVDGKCSDGAPLLKVNKNLKLVSKSMSTRELLTAFYEQNQSVFKSTAQNADVSEVDLFNLSLGIWNNYWPEN